MALHPPEFYRGEDNEYFYWGEDDDPPTWRGSCVVQPKVAFRLLNVSPSRGHQLLRSGALESYRDGPTRQITVRSIRRYLAHQLATGGTRPLRRPGGPRRQEEGEVA
jgi:hypothetical protein